MESRAFAGLAVHFDLSSMFAHNSVGNRKTQTGALARGLGGEERIVDTTQMFRGNSRTGVPDFRIDGAIVAPGANGQRTALLHRVARVQEKVEEHLLQLACIALDGRERIFKIEIGVDPRLAS